jgi:hypothetical protein
VVTPVRPGRHIALRSLSLDLILVVTFGGKRAVL